MPEQPEAVSVAELPEQIVVPPEVEGAEGPPLTVTVCPLEFPLVQPETAQVAV